MPSGPTNCVLTMRAHAKVKPAIMCAQCVDHLQKKLCQCTNPLSQSPAAMHVVGRRPKQMLTPVLQGCHATWQDTCEQALCCAAIVFQTSLRRRKQLQKTVDSFFHISHMCTALAWLATRVWHGCGHQVRVTVEFRSCMLFDAGHAGVS